MAEAISGAFIVVTLVENFPSEWGQEVGVVIAHDPLDDALPVVAEDVARVGRHGKGTRLGGRQCTDITRESCRLNTVLLSIKWFSDKVYEPQEAGLGNYLEDLLAAAVVGDMNHIVLHGLGQRPGQGLQVDTAVRAKVSVTPMNDVSISILSN